MKYRPWVCSVALASLLSSGCVASQQDPPPKIEEPPAAAGTSADSNRRIFEGCNRAERAERYRDLVGEEVLITWAWKEVSAASAGVKVPAVVLRIDSPYVVVTFNPKVSNLELYTSVWLYSGHIQSNPDGSFRVDPCSAKLERGGW